MMPAGFDQEKPTICFILGIKHRCGTNYLFQLLSRHPEITPLLPLSEDFLVFPSDLLVSYTHSIYNQFGELSRKEIENTFGPPDTLLRYLGDGLIKFLTQEKVVKRNLPPDLNLSAQKETTYYVIKTPSTAGIENFFRMFPDQRLILLVRDGRSVVESGIRVFDWDFESEVRDWEASAQRVINFIKTASDFRDKVILVRYEDLFSNTRIELSRILSFLNLDLHPYDFSAAENQEVIGSSDARKHKENPGFWQPEKKTGDFSPIKRWDSWNRSQHERFNWLAGDSMAQFGYSLKIYKNHQLYYRLWNRILDTRWRLKYYLNKNNIPNSIIK